MNVNAISCNCGHRVVARDVLQRNWYARVFGPSFMYIRFRCGRCRRVGERFIDQEKWDDSILREIPTEFTNRERRHFEQLGKISVDEEIEFHFELEQPGALSKLIGGSEDR